ncbi:hypothetical protein ACOMHN_049104 [Nucella lapillus]
MSNEVSVNIVAVTGLCEHCGCRRSMGTLWLSQVYVNIVAIAGIWEHCGCHRSMCSTHNTVSVLPLGHQTGALHNTVSVLGHQTGALYTTPCLYFPWDTRQVLYTTPCLYWDTRQVLYTTPCLYWDTRQVLYTQHRVCTSPGTPDRCSIHNTVSVLPLGHHT